MKNRNPSIRVTLFLCLWLVLPGCGGEEVAPDPDPGEFSSCETLESQVLQDPLTGGAFHCLWCGREWKWTIHPNTGRMFVLVALTCERLRSRAHLEVKDSHASVVWSEEVQQGDAATYCVAYDRPGVGTWSVRLRGSRDLPFSPGLIEEFRGSVYLKVFNERGALVMDPDF
jgi:hypothetical protein